MDATEQAIDQTMRLTFTGAEYVLKLSGAGAKHLASALWSVATTQEKTKGKARLESLLKSGKELKVFNIAEGELAAFAKQAKHYGVLYAVIKGSAENPGALVDIMVKTEDAAKINRIVEKLEFGKYDETSVMVEVEKERASQSKDGTEKGVSDKGVAQKDTDELTRGFITNQKAEANANKNPTAAKTGSPHPSEHSSKTSGYQAHATPERKDKDGKAGDKADSERAKTRDYKGFDAGGRERASVKEKIEEKRQQRDEKSKQPNTPQQTRHKQPQQNKRGKSPRHKPERGR